MSGKTVGTPALQRVSVILPAFNAARFLPQALESVLSQSFHDLEILAADDASTDATREVLEAAARRDRRFRLLHNSRNSGPGEARRRLVERARGQLVVFQDADDISLPGRFEKLIAAFDAEPSLALCGSAYRYRFPGGRTGPAVLKPLDRTEILEALSTAIPYCCATIMARRDLILECGSFRDYFNRLGCEDFDLALRLTERHEARNLPDVLYEYRLTPGSFSRSRRDPRQAIMPDVVRALAAERRVDGTDSLDRQDHQRLREIEESLLAPFKADPSLDRRLMAGALLSIGDADGAIRCAWSAVRSQPWRLANHRAWIYCLRKALPVAR